MYLHFRDTDLVYTKVDMEFYMITLQIEAIKHAKLERSKTVVSYIHNVTGFEVEANGTEESIEKKKKDHCDMMFKFKKRHIEIGNILDDKEIQNLFGKYYAEHHEKLFEYVIYDNWTTKYKNTYLLQKGNCSAEYENIKDLIIDYSHCLTIEEIAE